MRKFVCSICGKAHEDVDKYLKCVEFCAGNLKAEQERINKEYLENLNAALNGVKSAEKYYNEKLNEFKEKYPKEYELNFCQGSNATATIIEDSTNKESKDLFCIDPSKFIKVEVSKKNNPNGKIKKDIKINDKKVDEEVLKKLLEDPELEYINKLLGF